MKTQDTVKIFMSLIAASIIFTACQSENDNLITQESIEQFSAVAVQTETEVDNITDDISSIVDQTFDEEESENKLGNNHTDRFLPDCAIITRVITDTTKDITIDFGESCELNNGNIVSGKILIHYLIDKTALTRTVTVSFDNFFNNGKKIEGGYSVFKERQNTNGNPQSTHTINISITWPDGSVASKNGTKIHELIEGKDTRAWGDNVYLITGNWNFTRKDGTIHVVTITTALRKELSCRFIVSGVISFQQNDRAAILDFGDGECDDLATLTRNGVTETIHLRR